MIYRKNKYNSYTMFFNKVRSEVTVFLFDYKINIYIWQRKTKLNEYTFRWKVSILSLTYVCTLKVVQRKKILRLHVWLNAKACYTRNSLCVWTWSWPFCTEIPNFLVLICLILIHSLCTYIMMTIYVVLFCAEKWKWHIQYLKVSPKHAL